MSTAISTFSRCFGGGFGGVLTGVCRGFGGGLQADIEYQSVVLFFVAIMAWLIAAAFVGVYAMVVRQIRHCRF